MKKAIVLLLCALLLSACGNTDEKTSASGTASGAASEVSEAETVKGKYKKAITTDSAGAAVSTTEYEYDSDGNVIREAVTYASGESEVTVYEYAAGRLQRKVLTTGGNAVTTSTVEYIYDGDRVVSEKHSDGSTVVYTYDDNGRLGKTDDGTQQIIYRYSSSGVLGQMVLTQNDAILAVTDYAYYEDGLLATETEKSSHGRYTFTYHYDDDGNLIRAVASDSNGAALQTTEYIY